MTKGAFYQDKELVTVEWWLPSCDLPDHLTWAGLRVFDDGTADSCFGQHTKLYGFENRDYAGYILSEDEYVCFNDWDEADEQEYGIKIAEIQTPTWKDDADQPFEYLGTY